MPSSPPGKRKSETRESDSGERELRKHLENEILFRRKQLSLFCLRAHLAPWQNRNCVNLVYILQDTLCIEYLQNCLQEITWQFLNHDIFKSNDQSVKITARRRKRIFISVFKQKQTTVVLRKNIKCLKKLNVKSDFLNDLT